MTTTALFGLYFTSAALWLPSASPNARLGLFFLGLAGLGVSASGYLSFLKKPAPDVSLMAGAIRVGISTHIMWGRLLQGLPATVLITWAVAAAWPGGVLIALLLPLPLALVPDSIRAILRSPEVRLMPDRLQIVGWAFDASVSWDDVLGAELATPWVRRPVVRVQYRPGAITNEKYYRIAQKLDGPRENALDIPLLALGQPGRLQVFIQHMAQIDASQRPGQITEAGVPFLDGTIQAEPSPQGV